MTYNSDSATDLADAPTNNAPKKKRRTLKILISTIAILIVVLLGAILIPFTIKFFQNKATAADGYLYEANDYTVLFPGEPKPTPDLPEGQEAVMWSNPQKMYQSATLPLSVVTAESVKDSAVGCATSSGASLMGTSAFEIDGEEAAVAWGFYSTGELEGKSIWCAAVISPKSEVLVSLVQVGRSQDDAFFESLTLTQ